MESYTPMQHDLLMLLSDGKPHTKDEIREHVRGFDDYTPNYSIHYLIHALRKKLAAKSQDIVCVVTHGTLRRYQQVRKLHGEND